MKKLPKFFVLLIIIASCKSNDVNKETFIKVSSFVVMKMDNILKQAIAKVNQKILTSSGWKMEGDSLVKEVSFPNRKVMMSNGQMQLLDKNSMINLKVISDKVYPVSIVVDGVQMKLARTGNQSVNEDEKFKIAETYLMDIQYFLTNMDGCCSKNGSSGKNLNGSGSEIKLAVPRCKDYNGGLGNGQNDQSFPQNILNYIDSDCDRATGVGYCLLEHSNNMGGCFKTHNGKICSDLISNPHQ